MSPVVPGVGVTAVDTPSPAEAAGILPSHIVTEVNGSVVRTALELEQALLAFPAGSRVPVGVWDRQSVITRELQQPDGVVVTGVVAETDGEPSPAAIAGIEPRDVVWAIDGVRVVSLDEFTRVLREHRPSERISLDVGRNGTRTTLNATLAARPDDPTLPFLGVELALLPSQALGIGYIPLAELVQFYTNPGLGNAVVYIRPPVPGLNEDLTPYSSKLQGFYSSSLGDWYPIWANSLFWIFWVNFNVAIFNALPIYPLDGGQALKSLLQGVASKRLGESGINRVTLGITFLMVALVGMMLAVPWFGI
jgi:membrane-associated protease RseP (regulator of RpoE activity)